MFYKSSLIEYSTVIELTIEQLDVLKLKFEKDYSNLNLINLAILSNKTDISKKLLFDKISSKNLQLDKKFNLNKENQHKLELIQGERAEINGNKSIKLENSITILLKSIDLFEDSSFLVNYEQKSYLELILLMKLLDELKTEIFDQGSYALFYNNLSSFKLQDNLTTKIFNDLRNNSKNVRHLKSKILLNKNKSQSEFKDLDLSKKSLVHKKSRNLFKNKLLDGYFKNWKKTNLVNFKLMNEKDIKILEKSIEQLKSSIQIENQAHDLMTLALNKEIRTYENKSNELEMFYNSSTEQIQIELNKLKIKFESQREKLKNLKEDYDYKLNIVSNYREEKAEEENLKRASKIISNWWLGVKLRMRRLKLK